MTYPDERPFGGTRGQDGPDFTDTPPTTGAAPTTGAVPARPAPMPSGSDRAKDVASHTGDRAKDVAGTAKSEAGVLKDTAKESGAHVVESVKDEAANVVDEAKYQSRRLLDEGLGEFRTQAGAGQQRIATVVRALSDELDSMARGTDQSGPMVDFVSSVERYGHQAADFLERSEPEEVLDSVRRYAARNPWAFLAISAGVGFLGARLVRGLQGAKSDEEERRYSMPAQRVRAYDSGYQTTDPGYTPVGETYPTGGQYPAGGTTPYPAGGTTQYPAGGQGYSQGEGQGLR